MKPYKGVANSPCAARKLLGVSWYYNWMQSEDEPCADGLGGEFVPMIWGHTGAEREASAIQTSVTKFASSKYAAVLGFNEPDNPSQSNIPVAEAIQLWPSFDNPALRIGSPGTAANATPGQAWFKDFMTQLNANPSLRADFLAIHWYGWNAGSCDAKASQLENYLKWAEAFPGDRPIWITEWGCLNQSAPDEATVVAFYKAAVAMFAKHPRVERYAGISGRRTATSTPKTARSRSWAKRSPKRRRCAEHRRHVQVSPRTQTHRRRSRSRVPAGASRSAAATPLEPAPQRAGRPARHAGAATP
jgi:hypothetical protein